MNRRNPRFPTTRWTLLQSAQSENGETSKAALEEICRNYWYPIYSYLRGKGRTGPDAEDLTQMLFAKLVSDKSLFSADPDRGKLRTFLLAVLNRLVSNDNRSRNTLKRGGAETLVSFDAMAAEERYRSEPVHHRDPESIYLQEWAISLFEAAKEQLRSDFVGMGKGDLFDRMEPFLKDDESKPPYPDLALELESSEAAVRLLVHRLRKKFRAILEKEVSKTVLEASEVEEEMKWFRETFSGR